ncbi:hypothetical protein HY029_03465 [Candidatus Gottesmanbacteria bacterium]|nr:hypothetical protein [Candidatus Gottesmanbacteria bacterium]
MFDARIVTIYHQNPYIHSALDFPSDLWTRFMHWTHRTYPYGPIWLLITLPFSFLGFGKFVLTLFNFKFLFTLFHLGNVYFIYKILTKLNPKLSLLGTALYAFNPVVLIESLVSPHNEVAMLFFLLLGIYFISSGKNSAMSILNLLLSAGIKFATIILLPLFLFIKIADKPDKYMHRILLFLLIMVLPVILEIIYREPYSWYFIPLIGMGALLVKYSRINILISGISLAAFLRYLPFIYTGDYSRPVRNVQDLIFISTISITILIIFIYSFTQKMINKKIK